MNLARFTVSRPVFTTMVTLIAVIVGAVSLARLPIDLMPEVTYPTLTISAGYENASPEEVEELITRPIEQAVAAVAGVESINSNSSEGISNVRVSFAWGTDIDVAANDLRDRLDRIMHLLPDDVTRPQVRKFDISATPVLILGAASPLDPLELRRLIDEQMSFRVERVPGVASLDVWGGLEREIQVNLLPDKIQALGLTLDGIRQAIRDANITVPAGEIERGRLDVTLRTPGQFTSLEELAATVLTVRGGAPITLEQVAEIRDTHRKVTRIVRINDQPGVRLAVRKQPDANTVQVAREVLREVERLNRDFPYVEIVPIIDFSEYIQRSIDNVGRSLLYGGALASLVLLFFLRSVRSALVVAVAIPVSVVATFALVYFGGFTLNLMTLGGLALGVGMMVDSAIVVLENIARLRDKERLAAPEAAVRGTGEVAAAIVAGTLTTLVIFLPMLFAEQLAGILFRQLALVVGFALLAALVVALTLTPMLAARLVQPPADSRGRGGPAGGLLRLTAAIFSGLEEFYQRLLAGAMRNRGLVIIGFMSLFLLALMLLSQLGSEFLPQADEGQVRIAVEMETGTQLALLDRKVREVERIVLPAVPETRSSVVQIGGTSFRTGAPANADIRLALVPARERQRSSEEIAAALRPLLQAIPGARVTTRSGGLFILRLAAGGEDERLSIEVRGFELDLLDRMARQVRDAIVEVEGITDLRLSREGGVPLELLRIDRQRAADLGLSVAGIARTIETAMAGSTAGQFRDGGNEYRIFMRLKDAEQLDFDDILNITVRNDLGEFVALRNVVMVERAEGPLTIERQDQQRISRIQGNLSGRDMGSVVADVRAKLAEIPVPRGIDITFGGDYEQQEKAFSEMALGLLLAVILVYMVMASLYESLRDPLIVMFSVPMALIGVVTMLLFTGTTLNANSYIGGIMLVGIVVNNAILIVDQASRLRRGEGWSAYEAAMEAGRRRLRPILMTTLTTTFAMLPLALGMGEGSEQQAPMARAVVGGLLSSAFITLLLIPVLYSLFYARSGPTGATGAGGAGQAGAAALVALALPVLLLAAPVPAAAGEPDIERYLPRPRAEIVLPAPDAQGRLPLTVEEAVFLALRNNRALGVQLYQPLIAGTFVEQERAVFDPALFAEATASREKSRLGDDYLTSEGENYRLGLERELSGGTALELALEQQRREPVAGGSYQQRAGAYLTLTQALLRGGSREANLAGIRRAELESLASLYELRGFTEALVAEVENSYWNLVLAQSRIAIFQESLRVAEAQLRDVQRRIEVGTVPEIEVAAAEAELAFRRQSLIDGESRRDQARIDLLRLLNPQPAAAGGGGDNWSIMVVPQDQPRRLELQPDPVADHVALAVISRPDLEEARLRLKRGELDIVQTRNGLLPRLDLFLSLGKTGYADSFGSSWSDIGEGSGYAGSLGLRFNLNLGGNRAAGAADSRARASQAQARAALANLAQLVVADVHKAHLEANRAYAQIFASTERRRLQEKVLRVEQVKFEVGRGTALAVAQAQRDLLESQLAEVDAIIAHRRAITELYRLDGSLLNRRAIRIED
ncbi:efflux RND transporter permease subunit [Desulfurivibrio sp. D14AmB]|uniref:efflux RND transporter permease subunit n=1 Tax=Desulfurivibrio sp. D14AmB TaxID=3374370 RepID=UPI00376F4231